MTKSIEKIIVESYEIWRKNLKISLPFLLNFLFSTLLFAAIFSIPLVLLLFGILEPLTSFLLFLLMSFLYFILWNLINSFFTASAISMSKYAINGEKLEYKHIFHPKMKSFGNLFIFYLFYFIFLIVMSILLGLVGTLLRINFLELFLISITLLLYPVPYAIVLDKVNFIEGSRRGIEFFSRNKSLVTLLYFFQGFIFQVISVLFYAAIFIVIGTLILLISNVQNLTQIVQSTAHLASGLLALLAIFLLVSLIINILVISPIFTIIWTNFYLKGENE
ncbi:MAG TPA: hypothetical protein ENG50_02580 [Candidatus Altiarchaeales archaeon]|nr:hypothetical protein [Candidatus Altiarchaeales archaeon]